MNANSSIGIRIDTSIGMLSRLYWGGGLLIPKRWREREKERQRMVERERERDRKKGRSEERKKERKEVKERKEGKKGGRKENGSRDWQIICLCRQASTNNSIERSTLRLLHCCCTHLSGHFELFCLPWYSRLWGMAWTVRHTLFVSASSSFSPYLLFQF